MDIKIHDTITDIPTSDWNQLLGNAYPFLRHEFLAALENNHCTGPEFGWLARHITVHENNTLVGAMAMYEKDNSYGEFVFDWSWADAYQRNGLSYYPKLVVAAPYTPATGPRLLVSNTSNPSHVKDVLIRTALEMVQTHEISSLHCLFTNEADTSELDSHGLLLRMGVQFHWQNHGYRDFSDFLDGFTAKKRKNVKQERRQAQASSVEIEIVRGDLASDEQLEAAELFYRTTFDRKWGTATLNLGFFQDVARSMGEQLVLFLARKEQRYVAGAICFQSEDTLYGRHWGEVEHFPYLHFELCYYKGIEYCIEQGLQYFEPGAQGEHKISRGFLPTPTWSAHWIKNPEFHKAIAHFLQHERNAMLEYRNELDTHSPYRVSTA